MRFPLELKNCGCYPKQAAKFLGIVFGALTLLCAVSAQGQEVVRTMPAASSKFYPQTLDFQLRRIAESPALEVYSLRNACLDILEDMSAVVAHLESDTSRQCPELQRLENSVKRLEELRNLWPVKVSSHQDDPEYVPSATALEEISLALQRRIYIWKALLQAKDAVASPLSTLYEKSFEDVDRLKGLTFAVEQYFKRSRRLAEYRAGLTWCDYLETQSWITELEACQQSIAQPIRRVSFSSTPVIPVEILRTLVRRANATVHRLESPTLTNEQRVFLNNPMVRMWKEELQSWRADPVAPISLLRFVEQYEANGGMSDMKALAQFVDLLSMSKTAEYQQLGENIRLQYGMANARVFLSGVLLNNHLPKAGAEIASFREYIQSQPTVGRRQTATEFEVSLIPHPTRILTSLNVGIDLATVTRSDAFATQLFNTGRTLVVAQKTIELTEKGFITEPSRAQIVAHRMKLVRMDTGFDYMPVVAGLFRRTVLDQYESKAASATTEAQRKILRQVRSQIDRETAKKLNPINEKIRELTQYADEKFGLRVEGRESRTDENWLLSAWGVRGKDTLLSSTPAPETLPGSYADLKVHESLPNMLLGKLEFEGKRASVGEFKEMLAEKFRQPGLATPEENDHVEVTFSSYNPLVVRFVDGRIELTISIAALRLFGKTHRDFQVIVRYKPTHDPEGRLVLERDSYISLVNVRDRFLMLTVFGKIFPVSRPFPLVPKMLANDPQFDYLTTGHCRIEKGWLALALVQKGIE